MHTHTWFLHPAVRLLLCIVGSLEHREVDSLLITLDLLQADLRTGRASIQAFTSRAVGKRTTATGLSLANLPRLMAAQKLLKAASSLGFEPRPGCTAALRKACTQAEARTVVEWLADILQRETEG